MTEQHKQTNKQYWDHDPSNEEQARRDSDQISHPNLADIGDFARRGTEEVYSYHGVHEEHDDTDLDEQDAFGDEPTEQDQYGDQDQFGDIDDNNPYSNLGEQEETKTNAGEDPDPDTDLYGLAEPLAKPGDVSGQGSDRDRYGTRRSQDQQGYQQ